MAAAILVGNPRWQPCSPGHSAGAFAVAAGPGIGRPDDLALGAEAKLVESAMRELAIERHLAAFKAGTDRAAAAGGLALAATAAGLAMAAAFAAADAFAAVHSAGDVLEFVEFHWRLK
jgi:hypothetical protein